MTLGEKLRQARLEAGLSQRQLCGDEITRNMLSQIENGSASPSMKTLGYLASQLGKPISWFLEDSFAASPNQRCMETAWECFEAGVYSAAQEALACYQAPDALYDREQQLLSALVTLSLAEQAIAQGRIIYARELLIQKVPAIAYLPELERRRVLLLGRVVDALPGNFLPNVDAELLILAKAAMFEGNWGKAARLLDAAQNQTSPEWNLLRGKAALAQQEYGTAAKFLQLAEEAYPDAALPALEIAFRELEDYKMAYYYAARQRK